MENNPDWTSIIDDEDTDTGQQAWWTLMRDDLERPVIPVIPIKPASSSKHGVLMRDFTTGCKRMFVAPKKRFM